MMKELLAAIDKRENETQYVEMATPLRKFIREDERVDPTAPDGSIQANQMESIKGTIQLFRVKYRWDMEGQLR